jgi:hypothetical protein
MQRKKKISTYQTKEKNNKTINRTRACVVKGQRFASVEEITATVTRALTEISKNCFQEYFHKLYESWQKFVIAQENYFKGKVV